MINLFKSVRIGQLTSLHKILTLVNGTPKDWGCDRAVDFASLPELSSLKVLVGFHDVVVDGDIVDKDVFLVVNLALPGVSEGITHGFKFVKIFGAIVAVFHRGSNLRDELTESVNSINNFVEGAVLEVFDRLIHNGYKWVDALDACVKVVNALSIERFDEDAINEFGHILSIPFNVLIILSSKCKLHKKSNTKCGSHLWIFLRIILFNIKIDLSLHKNKI